MRAWLQHNWKLLAAAVAVFVVVILLYLRSRSSAGAGTISFPGSAGSAPSDGAPSPGSVGAAVQDFLGVIRSPGGAPAWDPTHKGIPLWSGLGAGSVLELIPFGSQVQILNVAQGPPNAVSGETTYYQVDWGGVVGWISSFDLASFLGLPPSGFGQPSGSSSSGSATPIPQPNTPTPIRLGVGGPGRSYANLQRAALAAQAAAHQASFTDPRRSRRLALDAVQAARESRRIGVESRGAAPVGGPGAIASGLRRVRWPR